MKAIEQKLKSDATIFMQQPNDLLHDNIMKKIRTTSSEVSPKASLLKWLIPTGFTITALALFTLNLSEDVTTDIPSQEVVFNDDTNNNQEVSIDLFAMSLESKLTNDIKLEQQAIINDLNHFKGLLKL